MDSATINIDFAAFFLTSGGLLFGRDNDRATQIAAGETFAVNTKSPGCFGCQEVMEINAQFAGEFKAWLRLDRR